MAFEVITLKDQEDNMAAEIATERLYRTADGRVVEEGDPDAAFLLAAVGQPIPAGYEPPVEKAVKPASDKARKPAANKGKARK